MYGEDDSDTVLKAFKGTKIECTLVRLMHVCVCVCVYTHTTIEYTLVRIMHMHVCVHTHTHTPRLNALFLGVCVYILYVYNVSLSLSLCMFVVCKKQVKHGGAGAPAEYTSICVEHSDDVKKVCPLGCARCTECVALLAGAGNMFSY